MSSEQETYDRAFMQGQEAGRMDSRLSNVENAVIKMGNSHEKSMVVQNGLITTVELLAKDIQARSDADKMLRAQEKLAAEEKAEALKEERTNAAQVLKDERESKATTLANESNSAAIEVNKLNKKWVPRSGWIAFWALIVAGLSILVAVFFGALTIAKDSVKTPCVVVANVGCVVK